MYGTMFSERWRSAVTSQCSIFKSEDQHADIQTRALGRNRLEKHRDFLLERV